MKHFKPHIQKMRRYQTSLGRDLAHGVRLDRNEKISVFSDEVMKNVWGLFKNYSLSASPEAAFLYKSIAEYLKVDEKQIYISCGITEGIRFLYDMCTEPGDNIICLDPTYPMYEIYAQMYQIDYRRFSYNPSTFKPDVDTLHRQLDSKTKFVIMPNPNLPIESVYSLEEMDEFAKLCKKNGSMLVIDEAYYYFGGPTCLSLVNKHDNVILFRTFSKAYGLAGLRIGFMVSNPTFIDYISKSRSIVESNMLSMQIADYFLKNTQMRDQHIKEVREGQTYIRTELDKLGVKWHGGKVSSGIMIFLNNAEESAKAVAYMKERKIYIRGSFDPPFQNSIRISIGEVPAMEKFVVAFKEWIKQR